MTKSRLELLLQYICSSINAYKKIVNITMHAYIPNKPAASELFLKQQNPAICEALNSMWLIHNLRHYAINMAYGLYRVKLQKKLI